jgi:hypothetical protein
MKTAILGFVVALAGCGGASSETATAPCVDSEATFDFGLGTSDPKATVTAVWEDASGAPTQVHPGPSYDRHQRRATAAE